MSQPVHNPYAKIPRPVACRLPTAAPDERDRIALLDQAASTTRGRATAMKHFDAFQRGTSNDLFGDIIDAEDDEARGDHVVSTLVELVEWWKKHPIQAQGKDRSLVPKVATQYLGQIKEEIKDRFGSLPIWDDHEKRWYSQLMRALFDAYKRALLDGDTVYRDPTTRSLVLITTPGQLLQCQRDWIDMQGADQTASAKAIACSCSLPTMALDVVESSSF